MKYTKGPWTYRVNPDISDQWRSSHWIDGPKPHTQPICEVRNYQKLGENNAPLIAAAPDMYEALKEIHDVILGVTCSGWNPQILVAHKDKIQNIIAKAEGK